MSDSVKESIVLDKSTVADLSQAIGVKVSDFLDEKILTVSEFPQKKFQTHYNYTPQGGSEVNSGQYIIDDSQYIDFKKLLQRSANCSKEARDFLSSIPVVDNVGGIDENQLQDVINNNETAVSVDKSNELSTGEVESPIAQETSNPVENSTDVVSEAETNGKE